MRLFARTLSCLALTVFSAAALEKEFVDQLLQSARNIERDSSVVGLALKTKRIDAEDLKAKIDAMSADLTKLQELVTQYESTHPTLSERDRADWLIVKEKVQLLEIFHDQKKKLAAEDLSKNRALIRAHANGIAMRAQKLQESAAKLQRMP
jgi:hypothetical protein